METTTVSQVATTKPSNEWPGYLNKLILDVLSENLHFSTMTPVQVKPFCILMTKNR